jgi:hypothetical protein
LSCRLRATKLDLSFTSGETNRVHSLLVVSV